LPHFFEQMSINARLSPFVLDRLNCVARGVWGQIGDRYSLCFDATEALNRGKF
jgi:hypothetical protein